MCHIFFMRSIFDMIFLSIVEEIVGKIWYKKTIDNHQSVCQACSVISKWQLDLTIEKEQFGPWWKKNP